MERRPARLLGADDRRARRPRVLAQEGQRGDPRPHARARRRTDRHGCGCACCRPRAGIPTDQIAAFRSSFAELRCSLSHVSLFRLETEAVDLAAHLLDQDLIYVGGGSMLNLLAVWRAHGIDEVLTECWRRGVVLAGQSAGAMCWFECGVTRSAGTARLGSRARAGPGVLSVHYHRDADRRQTLLDEARPRAATASMTVPALSSAAPRSSRHSLAHEDAAVVAGRCGGARQSSPREVLDSPRPAIDEIPDEVFELRAVRALRSGQALRRPRRRARPAGSPR